MAPVPMRISRSVRRVLNPRKWLDCAECGLAARIADERCPRCGFEIGFFERLTQHFATVGSALSGADELEWVVKEGGGSSPETLRKRLAEAGWRDAEIETVLEMLGTEKAKIEDAARWT
jgi:hypothetical protein